MSAALGEMGISVLSGMATSALASVPLFLCIIMTFNKFGSFLCMTVVLSWFWANFGFMGLCAQFGPQPTKAKGRQAFDKTAHGRSRGLGKKGKKAPKVAEEEEVGQAAAGGERPGGVQAVQAAVVQNTIESTI